MKIKQNYIIDYILVNIIILLIFSCESPEIPNKTSHNIAKDTTAALVDTQKSHKKVMPKMTMKHKPLKLIIKELASSTAPVIVGIYKSNHKFLFKESRLKEYKFIPKGNTLTCYITDLNYGELALAIYQDMNNNGKFDKTFIGMPKEGYAFSNNFIPTVKAPDYDDCKFTYDSTANVVTMNLIRQTKLNLSDK